VTRVAALTGAERGGLPACCVDCTFWQSQKTVSSPLGKARWVAAFEDEHGAWGRILLDGDAFLGMLQYGPASAFPRARTLPTGPPNPDGALVTCAFVDDADPVGALERLLLEALADLKSRDVPSVDVFATTIGQGAEAGHHTLLDRALLERLGFLPVRSRGEVTLMRLALGGIEPSRRTAPASASVPTPAVPNAI
jgi:hypothetical protein